MCSRGLCGNSDDLSFSMNGPPNLQTAPAPTSSGSSRIPVLDALRGIAAVAVMWYHFTQATRDFLPDGSWLKATGTYGWTGVEVFFVISGFVIPYAMYRAAYQLRQYGTFLLRRVVRLDPPYFVSVILAIVAFGAISKARGVPDPRLTPTAILLHVGYLNVFFPKRPWLNVAYWTLAVEVQYYLTVGLLFPLLRDHRRIVRLGMMATVIALCRLIPSGEYASTFVLVFMVGFVLFQMHIGLISTLECCLLVLSLCVGIALTLGPPEAFAAAFAALLIGPRSRREPPRAVTFFGDISYSLYLVHGVTGLLLIPMLRDLGYTKTWFGMVLALIGAAAFSVGSAYVLYRCVELPAKNFASRVGRAKQPR
jgi:peptidoglycan/LPS O-acetylase OafA/YrhL